MTFLFLFLFLVGVVGTSLIITRKIPLVIATPRQVVDDYFQQESARLHIRVLRIKSWIRRGAYWSPLLLFLIRILRILRIGILKLDRHTFQWLQAINEFHERWKAANGNGSAKENRDESLTEATSPAPRYWENLKAAKDKILNLQKPKE